MDSFAIRMATVALALGFLGSMAMIGWLASTQTPIPDAISDMPLYTGGALAALLPGALGKVRVDNPPSDPVNVTTEDEPAG